MSVDIETVPVTHRAQKQALTDLLTQLEQQSSVAGATGEEIEAAQAAVSRDMGW